MLLTNARIYTFNPRQPLASALAIEDGRICAVGDAGILRREFDAQPAELDLHGQVILPGLTDGHIHLEYYALGLRMVDCETATRQECLDRVAQRAAQLPRGTWILGHGWNQNSWPEGFGTAADLDGVAPDHPVYLTAKSLHAGWANSAALRLAEVQERTPDPAGGKLGASPGGRHRHPV